MEIVIDHDEYLMHYGVKGMKWGIRKKRSEPVTKWGQRRKKAEDHNRKIKEQWERVKNDPNVSKETYNRARNARLKNLAGRFFVSGVAGKSIQGQYYQYRDAGETKTKALLKTAARRLPTRVAFNSAIVLGATALGFTSAGLYSDYYFRTHK